MDNLRLILFFALAFIGLMLYQAWMEDYGATPEPVSQLPAVAVPEGSDSAGVPTAAVTGVPDALDVEILPHIQESQNIGGNIIKVETDLLRVEISSLGGTIQRAYLLDYPVAPETPEQKFELLTPSLPDLFIAQSGLIGSKGVKVPNHKAEYQSDKTEYRLAEGQERLDVSMLWTDGNGIQVTKHFVFHRDSYLIDVVHEVVNQSGEVWAVRDYAQLQRSEPESSSGYTTYTYTGGVYYTPADKYEKVSFDDMADKKLSVDSAQGWLAMIQHYFLSAWVPPKEQLEHYYTNSLPGPKYLIGSYSPTVSVPADGSYQFMKQLYIGPKLQHKLETIAEGLELTVDYGWLTVLAKPLLVAGDYS
jgi:YidC/Oxa1 family membrane protein insertase